MSGSRAGLTLSVLLSSLLAHAAPDAAAQAGGDPPPNILLLIADDLGVDLVGAYAEHPDPAKTPVIDGLASQGVLFRNAYSNPVCSPTRAALITGRECRRTGFGWGTNYFLEGTELPLSEVCIPEVLPAGYRSFAVGKWHLGSFKLSGPSHPNLQGFEQFRGSHSIFPGAFGNGFYDWEKITDGVTSPCTTYATTETVNDTLELIQSAGSEPWFAWVALHAPHAPFHKPPADLHTYTLPDSIENNIPIHVKAVTEAMDTELGRLFDTLGPDVLSRTIVIFVGDNGTAHLATTSPFNPAHAKGTVYEGGVNVPLIISGPGVASGAECQGLVSVTDLFATIMELSGSGATATDSVSLVPYLSQPALPSLRSTVYSEMFKPNGLGAYSGRIRAVRGPRYKLMYGYDGSSLPAIAHLFDLQADPWETHDLLAGSLTPEQQLACAELAAVLAEPYVAWQPLNDPVPGTLGPPVLSGAGQLVPGGALSITLSDAQPGALCMLVVGGENLGLYFKGGVIVPRPDFLYYLVVPASGPLTLNSTWVAGIPAGFPILFQYWVQDPAAIYGWAGSNGLAATGQ